MLAVAEHQQIQSEIIPRIATGFCGGLAHTGGMCGAVSGGVMAVSLSLGRSSPSEGKDHCYEAERAFLQGFASRFGELNCQKLIGVQLGTAEGQALYKQKELKKQCIEYVGEAVRMALEVVEIK